MADLESRGVSEIELQELDNTNTEKSDVEDQYDKVLTRPYKCPTSVELPRTGSGVVLENTHHEFDEGDYKSHRRESFHYHLPLRPGHKHHDSHEDGKRKHKKKKKKAKEDKEKEEKRKSTGNIATKVEILPKIHEKGESEPELDHEGSFFIGEVQTDLDTTDNKEDSVIENRLFKPHKKHHRHRHHSRDSEGKDDVTDDGSGEKHRRHRHHHHHRTVTEKDQIKDRQRPGYLVEDKVAAYLNKAPTDLEEAGYLPKKYLDDIAGHRFGDLKGVRRRPIHVRHKSGMSTHFTSQDFSSSLQELSVKYDKKPHEAFVELEELTGTGKEREWKETARWIKFEEDVEASNRWGKPHVASLSFHSLLELRKGLEKGTILLDLEHFDISSIAEAVVENMVITDQLPRENSSKVLAALLSRHRHQHQQQQPSLRRKFSFSSLSTHSMEATITEKPTDVEMGKEENNVVPLKYKLISDSETSSMQDTADGVFEPNNGTTKAEKTVQFEPPEVSVSEPPGVTTESDVKERIPDDAEATSVLVGTLDELDQVMFAFVRLAKGCYLTNVSEVRIPVRFLVVILGPTKLTTDLSYREIGRSVATLMSDQTFHNLAYEARTREDLLSAINQFLEDSVVLAPGEWDRQVLLPILAMQSKLTARRRAERHKQKAVTSPEAEEDPLERTGKYFGGLVKDFKRKLPHFLSDFTDALNPHCFVSFFFVYFALFAPCIAFGGLISSKTEQWMGVSEMILATSVSGVVFGLFAGQPLIIIGGTGPVLVFEQSTYEFCKLYEIEYLSFRFWIGMWVMLICFGIVAFEGCFLVKYFTRFTEEIFATLISLIFVYEALHFLTQVFHEHPLQLKYTSTVPSNGNETNSKSTKESSNGYKKKVGQPNTALLTTMLMFGTFFIAFYLRKFRYSHFFGKRARRLVSDFGTVIAITVMLLVDLLVDDVYTEKLTIPNGMVPTLPDKRGWIINPFGNNGSLHPGWFFAAFIPAIMVSFLLFMETELTGVILNKKENKLKKGGGYNLDLFIVGLLCGVCSCMGLPWMCAATVRSVAYLNSLSVYSTTHAPGEKPYLIEIKEQRATAVAIHALIGISALMAPTLRLIPIAVLFGVFLYLGVISLSHIQLVERAVMLLMPSKHHPDVHYVRMVKTHSIHLYTLIQLAGVAILVAIKLTVAAPSFPFFILCLLPLRKSLNKVFSQQELDSLDKDVENYYDSDLDEYEGTHLAI